MIYYGIAAPVCLISTIIFIFITIGYLIKNDISKKEKIPSRDQH